MFIDTATYAQATAALSTYLGTLASGNVVTATAVTLGSNDGQPKTIQLTGNGGGTELLIIDASALPPGSVIDLNGIEFAVIIGAVTVTGGAGSNIVVGDGTGQYVMLGAENDTLAGGGGDDTIGSAGGADHLSGGDGRDKVFGGDGGDSVYGNRGADAVHGNAGGDWVHGGADNDSVYGGAAEDRVFGDKGDDWVCGDGGYDVLSGDAGDDRLSGGLRGDVLDGGDGDDVLGGGDGRDWLAGGQGSDVLDGGGGRDCFFFGSSADGLDTIADFVRGADAIVVSSPNFGNLPAGTLNARTFALSGDETADSRFVFNAATGTLFYDADGSGAQAATALAVMAPGVTLSAGDIFVLAG